MPISFTSLIEQKIDSKNSCNHLINNKFSLKKLANACIVSSAAWVASDAHAVSVVFNFTEGNTITVDEPNSGSRFVSVPMRVAFDVVPPEWSNASTCTVSGTVGIRPTSETLTPGVDVSLAKATFSMTTESQVTEGGVEFESTTDEVIFEIFDDGDEEESTESFVFEITQYGAVCGEVSRSISPGSYGRVIINDPFDEDPNTPQPQQQRAIPVRQKSLSSQLNSLRTLTLHSAGSRDRAIAEELNRARSSTGIRADNVQIKTASGAVTSGALLGAGAGDPLDDFGRFGLFVTGTIDTGEADKNNSDDEFDYDASQLIVGLDYHLTNSIVIGGALTWTDMQSGSDNYANTDFDRVSLSIFSSLYSSDAFYLDAIVSYGTNNYDLDRKIALDAGDMDSASATTDGDETSAFIGAGYNLHQNNLNLRLFTFVNYIDANIDGYQESVDGSSSAAKVDGVDLQSLTADVGAEFSWNVNTHHGVFTPMLSLAYEKQFADDAVDITGSFIGGIDQGDFLYQAPERDDSYLRGQIGVSGVFQNGFSAFVSYESYFEREDFTSSLLSLGIRWQF